MKKMVFLTVFAASGNAVRPAQDAPAPLPETYSPHGALFVGAIWQYINMLFTAGFIKSKNPVN
jgi:hypothetical protein